MKNIKGLLIFFLIGLITFSATLRATEKSSLESQFKIPPREARPWTYWMWLGVEVSHEAITRDLEEMYGKGIVGVIVYEGSLGTVWYPDYKMVLQGKEYVKVKTEDYGGRLNGKPYQEISNPVPFNKLVPWSDKWRTAIRYAAKEANRIGIDFCLSVNLRGLRESVSDEYGQQSLQWTEDSVKGPVFYTSKLAIPKVKRTETEEKKLYGKPYYRDIVVLAFPAKPTIKVNEVIDISSKMDTSGFVRWSVPAGKWKIVRFAQVANRFGNAISLFVDGMSTEAIDKAWASNMGKLLPEMTPEERKGLKFIQEDSWEAGETTWSKAFADEFKKRRGYDLIPYLPVLMGSVKEDKNMSAYDVLQHIPVVMGQVIGDLKASERIVRDYKLTINDLIAENHYAYKRKLVNSEGFTFLSEAAGPNMKQSDQLKNSSKVDVAMAEFWIPSAHRPTPERCFLVRDAANANHIYGKKVTLCEGFTSAGPHWEESPFSMKATADQAFCDGLNKVVFHTAALSPSMTAKPGYTFWAGTHYEPGITWWNQTPAFNDYLSRCSFLLQQGLFVSDVLIYQGDPYGFNKTAMKTVIPTIGEGFDYDNCNTEVLLSRLSSRNGRLMLPDGMSYRILVLPDNREMPLKALEKISNLLNGGAIVIGKQPIAMSEKPLKLDEEVKFNALVEKLWGNSTKNNSTEKRIGLGRLVWGKTAQEILSEINVTPDFEYKGLSNAGTIDWIHRTLNDGSEIYYVTSRWQTPEKLECTFRISGKQPELWNPVTGEILPVTAFKQENGRTIIPVEFDPCGSVFVVFRDPIQTTANGSTTTNYPAYKLQLVINGAWDVAFDTKWGGPSSIRFDELMDWTKRPEEGIKYYSGTAVYSKTFELPASELNNKKLILDLGQVNELATVTLNGHELGVVWTKPARVDITNAVKSGLNELKISVVNLWPNRLIGDAALPAEKRFTETNMRKFISTSPLFPSGLIGPVQVMGD